MYPSFIAMGISGFLITGIIIYLIMVSYNGYTKMGVFEQSIIVIGLATAIGIDGIAHAYAEVYYDFNPLLGKWRYRLNRK